MSALKLQKLIYYCQAWSLVWDGEPLFKERIQAWANGPVVYELFQAHRGRFMINHMHLPIGNRNKLTPKQKDTVNIVLDHYGDKSPQWLSDLTHAERPWQDARQGLPPEAASSKIIPLDNMAAYYESLTRR